MHEERAVLGNARVFLKTNRVFIERARLKIMMHVGDGETVLLESEYDRVHGVHLHWSCNSTVLAQPRAPAYRTKLLVVPGPSGLPTSTPPRKLSRKHRAHDANIVFPLPRKSLTAFFTRSAIAASASAR